MRKILSIDGGGCFGAAPAEVIRRSGCFQWDALAGTSIGAALAMSLGLGMQQNISADWFQKWMPEVFTPPSIWRKLNSRISQYDDTGLNLALQAAFGDLRFGECRVPTFILSVDIANATLKVWDSTDAKDGAEPAWEIVRRAVAAETYFRAWCGHADAGIMANNPSMCLIAACAKRLDWPLSQLSLVSLGTGSSAYESAFGTGPHGELTTAAWAVDVLLHGCSDCMHEYFASSLAPRMAGYLRVQFSRGAKADGWRMDNPDMATICVNKWETEINAAAAEVAKV